MSCQLTVAYPALPHVVHVLWHSWETCDILALDIQDPVEMNTIETRNEGAHPLHYQPVRVWVDHYLLDIRCVSFIPLLIIIPRVIIVIHPIVAVVVIAIVAVAIISVIGAILISSTSISATELVVIIIIIIIITSSSSPEVCESSLRSPEVIPGVPIPERRVVKVGFYLPLVRKIQS